MAERDINFEGNTYEEEDPYDTERRVASYFSVVKEQAARLAARRFEMIETANSAATEFVKTYRKIALGTEGLQLTEVAIQGPNVRVSNIVTEQTEGGRYVVTVDPEEPYVAAPRDSDLKGTCTALHVSMDQDDEGFFVTPMAMFVDSEIDEATLQVHQYPVADVHITKYIIAPLDDTEITVPVLEDIERRRRVISEVVLRHTEKPTKVTDALKTITAAITRSNPQTFTEFEQVESFHALSDLPEDENVEQVLEMFRGVMGKDRQILVRAEVYVGVQESQSVKRQVVGTFIDIVPNQETLEVNEPTMVIAVTEQGEGEERLVYVPLSRIEVFSF